MTRQAGWISMRHSVDYLYSLYDCLISINVPNDKARALVDAMERDMGTTLATKSDLDRFRSEIRQEITLVRKDLEILSGNVHGEIAGVRKDLEILSGNIHGEIAGVRKDLESLSVGVRGEIAVLRKDVESQTAGLRKDLESQATAFRKDMELLSTSITVRLGSMLVVGFGLTIASLRFVVA